MLFNSSIYAVWNIAAQKKGSSSGPRKLLLLTAHLDSINHENGDIHILAPGADDNASGSAGVLEIARIVAHTQFENDI